MKEPYYNKTCHELSYYTYLIAKCFGIIVTFIDLETGIVSGTYLITTQLPFLHNKIDILYISIIFNNFVMDVYYTMAENYHIGNYLAQANTSFDENIDYLNYRCREMYYLIKLESFYLIFYPTYIRKPEYQNESL